MKGDGLRARIEELRAKLDKMRDQRDRARAEAEMLRGRLEGKAANGLERIAEAEHIGYSGIDGTLRRAGLKPPWRKP